MVHWLEEQLWLDGQRKGYGLLVNRRVMMHWLKGGYGSLAKRAVVQWVRRRVLVHWLEECLKVHKIENFFDSDFGICLISLLVMSKY
jgi:hypothetical protein